jgi:muramoyltetrapeptide carboxypeptidase
VKEPYQVDRMPAQLRHAGKLEGVKGIIFGEMLNCMQHPEQGYRLEDVVVDALGDPDIPILYGFPTGHAQRAFAADPFGVRAWLTCGAESVVNLLEPAVAVE